jgi:hypothetical protein
LDFSYACYWAPLVKAPRQWLVTILNQPVDLTIRRMVGVSKWSLDFFFVDLANNPPKGHNGWFSLGPYK